MTRLANIMIGRLVVAGMKGDKRCAVVTHQTDTHVVLDGRWEYTRDNVRVAKPERLSAAEFVTVVLWHLGIDAHVATSSDQTKARFVAEVDELHIAVWRDPKGTSWLVWGQNDAFVDADLMRSEIADPEGVARGIRAWVERLTEAEIETFGGAA